jgi:hypothetical protein
MFIILLLEKKHTADVARRYNPITSGPYSDGIG